MGSGGLLPFNKMDMKAGFRKFTSRRLSKPGSLSGRGATSQLCACAPITWTAVRRLNLAACPTDEDVSPALRSVFFDSFSPRETLMNVHFTEMTNCKKQTRAQVTFGRKQPRPLTLPAAVASAVNCAHPHSASSSVYSPFSGSQSQDRSLE